MAGGIRIAAIIGLWGVALSLAFGSVATAQIPPDRPEVVSAPAPAASVGLQRPAPLAPMAGAYPAGPLAAWSVPYAVAVPQVPYLPRRVYRQAYRRGYLAVPQPVPYPTVAVYAYPYTVWLPQPSVYGEVLVGPRVDVYRPSEEQAVGSAIAPSAGRQPTPAVPRVEPSSGPLLGEPGELTPEIVPPPPAELGPLGP